MAETEASDEPQNGGPEKKKSWGIGRSLKWGSVLVVAIAVAGGGYLYYRHGRFYPATDDAYIKANVVGITPAVGGRLVEVPASDQQRVERGDLLFKVDPRPFADKVAEAKASLANARQTVAADEAAVAAAKARVTDRRTALDAAQKNFSRISDLATKHVSTQSQLDDAKAAVESAKAQLALAKAQVNQAEKTLGSPGDDNHAIAMAKAGVDQAELDLADTNVTAACGGRLSGFTRQKGDVANAMQNQGTLVCDERFWVYANYKETDLTRIRPGQSATVSVDMYPDHMFYGVVESIDPASGAAFSLLPPENSSGNWVKVTQRVPVRILITDAGPAYPLRVQTSAGVTVDTGTDGTPLGKARNATLSDSEAMKLAGPLASGT